MENRSLVTIAEHSKEKILYLLEMAKEFEKKPNQIGRASCRERV